MTTLQFIDARRRTLRPWHVVGTALLLAMLAFAMWSLSARAAVSSVTFTAVDSVAGTADATFEISFASANNDAFGIEVTFPAEFSLTQGAVTVVSTCGAFSEGALCRGASQINTNLSATAVGQTIHLEIPGTWNLAVGMISFRVTSGITNPDVLTNGGVYAGAGFTVATLGTVNRSEPAVAAAADVVLVASGPPATITLDGPAIVEAGVASDDFTLTVRDEFGNEAEVAEATTFTISGSDIGAATLEPASPIGIASGQSSVTFTYNQTAAGDQGVSASFASGDTNLAGKTSNSHEITVNPAGYSAAHSTVAVTGDSSLTYPGTTTVTLTAHDQFSNRIPTLTSLTVTFALTGTGSSIGTFGATSHQGAGVYQSTFTGAGAGTARTLEGRVGGAAATLGGGPTITVTPKALTVSGVTASDKVYNGNTTATVDAGTAVFVGVVDGDTVTLGGAATGTFADKSVDTGKTVTVAGITAGGADGGNYVVTQPTTTASITAKPLTAPGVAAVDKVYDNTTTATLDLSSTGMTPYEIGDIVQVSPDGYTATFASENVGTGIAVTVTGLALRGPDAANYTLTQPTGLTADITVRAITVTAGTDTRVYNRTNASSGTPTVTSGTLADGDTIAAITQSFQFGDIGSNKLLNVTGVVTDGNGGANYDLTRNNAYAGTITAKPLTVPGVTVSSKPYDRTNTATLDLAAPGLTAVEPNDDVSLNPSSVTATFASASAGDDIAVTVTGLSLSGGDAYNYTLTQPSGLTADITPLALTVYNVTASDKAYDGTTTATVDASTGTGFTGVLNGDIALIYGMATGAFSDPNAGTEKAVIISGITAGGDDGGNYTVTQPTVFADITPLTLTVTGVTASDKAYNGNTLATVNADAATFVGVLDGDTVDVAGTPTGAFADKNVDDDKTVTVAGITAGGADGGNYTVTQPTALANITAVALMVTGVTASDKEYNFSSAATINADSASFVGVVEGDTVTLGGTATGTFADPNAGTNKTVTVAGITATGADGANYTVTQPTTSASITAKALTVLGVTASDKVYNGNTVATVNAGSAELVGALDGDDVTPSGTATGTFEDKNVDTGKTVTIAGITVMGDDAGNYTVTQPTATADITPKPLTAPGVAVVDKVYDNTTTATLNLDSTGITPYEIGDILQVSPDGYTATFASENVGTGIAVTLTGLALRGPDAGNYTLTQPTGLTADITARAITVTAQTDTKVYSGTVASAVTPEVTGGAVQTGDTAAFIQTFNLTGAGTDKSIIPSGVVTDGDGGTNYTYTFVNNDTGVITPRPVTVPGVSAVNKVYDNTTSATLDLSAPGLTAIETWDTVTVDATGYTATFASADVDSGIAVTVSGLALEGAGAENYSLTQPEGLTANITSAPLTVTGVTAENKVHDGNSTATVNADSAEFEGVVDGDTVTLGGTATGTFANDNVGNDKTVTIAGITAGGDDGGNYTVTQPTATASITAVPSSGGSPSGSGSTPTPTQTPTADPSGPVVTLTDEDSTVVTAGEPTMAETQSSSGGTAEVTAPAGALPAGTTLTAASIDNLEELVSQAPAPADAQVLLAFVIEATDAQGNPLTGDFAQPLALEFNVPAESVPAGATAGEIVLAFWNGVSWTEVQGTVLFNADGTVTIRASVDHLTIFSVQHQPGRGSFSPAPAFAVSFTVWGGGGYELLDTAVGAGGAAWVMVDGRFHGYSVGAPAFVNASFRAMLPAGIASNTAVVVTRPR